MPERTVKPIIARTAGALAIPEWPGGSQVGGVICRAITIRRNREIVGERRADEFG